MGPCVFALVNLAAKVHCEGSRGSAQSAGLFYDCEPCEPCEPYKLKLLESLSASLARGLRERVIERSDPRAIVLGHEGSQLHKVHNTHLMPIPWAFLREPCCGPKVHSGAPILLATLLPFSVNLLGTETCSGSIRENELLSL
jgi:hypothetical protein